MVNHIKSNKFLFICIGIIFIASFFASIVQTSFGSVNIQLKKLETGDGQTLVYDLYKPKSANSSNKVQNDDIVSDGTNEYNIIEIFFLLMEGSK